MVAPLLLVGAPLGHFFGHHLDLSKSEKFKMDQNMMGTYSTSSWSSWSTYLQTIFYRWSEVGHFLGSSGTLTKTSGSTGPEHDGDI